MIVAKSQHKVKRKSPPKWAGVLPK